MPKPGSEPHQAVVCGAAAASLKVDFDAERVHAGRRYRAVVKVKIATLKCLYPALLHTLCDPWERGEYSKIVNVDVPGSAFFREAQVTAQSRSRRILPVASVAVTSSPRHWAKWMLHVNPMGSTAKHGCAIVEASNVTPSNVTPSTTCPVTPSSNARRGARQK